jgi:hypothetical protein
MNEGLARRIVYARSGGLCEPRIPDAGCTGLGAQWHHRKRRSQGGLWTPSNGLHICLSCHDYVTNTDGNYDACLAAGWVVQQHDDPAAVAALIHTITLGHGLILLDDEGMIRFAVAVCGATGWWGHRRYQCELPTGHGGHHENNVEPIGVIWFGDHTPPCACCPEKLPDGTRNVAGAR